MNAKFEKTFTVGVSIDRAWRAFADSHERSQWEAASYEIDAQPGGRVHWQLPGIESDGEVVEVVEHKLLRHREGSGPHVNAEITVVFEEVNAGTRITITHAGFGDPEQWNEWIEGTTIGWTQAIADLIAYLTTGVAARRFTAVMHGPGMTMHDGDAGVTVETIGPDGLAEQAGLRAGDLLLRANGVPIFTITDLWVLMREHAPGTTVEFEYVRDGQRCHGRGVLPGGWGPRS